MKLQTNKNHKKIDVNPLNAIKGSVRVFLVGGSIVLTLFNSATIVKSEEEPKLTRILIEEENDSEKEEKIITTDVVTNTWYKQIINEKLNRNIDSEITIEDLGKIEELNITVLEDCDVYFLNYCTNLKKLTLKTYDQEEKLKEINNLPNLEELNLYFEGFEYPVNKDTLPFITTCTNLKNLTLSGVSEIDQDYLDSLTSLEILNLNITTNCNINFKRLTQLQELNFMNTKPYTAAIYFTREDYNLLRSKLVKIKFNSTLDLTKTLEISDKLDEIANNFENTSSEKDKLNQILLYELDNLEYDENYDSSKNNCYYKEGNLYAVFNKEKQICGNYTALFKALANRLYLESDILENRIHSWILIKIEDNYYYVDPTYLDTINIKNESNEELSTSYLISNGKGESINWYLDDISETQDDEHIPLTSLKDLNINVELTKDEEDDKEEDEYSSITDVTNTKYEIEINNKKISIPIAILIGMLLVTGSAITIQKYKKIKRNLELKELDDLIDKKEKSKIL